MNHLLQSVKLGISLFAKNKLKNISIIKVEKSAQDRMLDSIQKYALIRAEMMDKTKKSWSMKRVLLIAKIAAVVGIVGIIGIILGKIIWECIKFFKKLDEQFDLSDKFITIFREFGKCNNNIFIFFIENWEKNLKIKQKLIDAWEYMYTKVGDMFKSAFDMALEWWKWLEDKFTECFSVFYSPKGEMDIKETYDSSKEMIRSPYDPQKMLPATDKEWKTKEYNNPEASQLTKPDDIELKTEGEPAEKQEKLPEPKEGSATMLFKAKDKLKNTMSDLGLSSQFNATLGGKDEKSLEEAKKKEEEELKNTSNDNVTETSKTIMKNTLDAALKYRFDQNPLLDFYEYLTDTQNILEDLFKKDSNNLNNLQSALEIHLKTT